METAHARTTTWKNFIFAISLKLIRTESRKGELCLTIRAVNLEEI